MSRYSFAMSLLLITLCAATSIAQYPQKLYRDNCGAWGTWDYGMGSATLAQPDWIGAHISGDIIIADGATNIVKYHFQYLRSGPGPLVISTVTQYVVGLVTKAVSELYVGSSVSFDEFTEYAENGVAKLRAVGHGSIGFKLTVTHDPQTGATPMQYETFYYDLFPDSAAIYTIDP